MNKCKRNVVPGRPLEYGNEPHLCKPHEIITYKSKQTGRLTSCYEHSSDSKVINHTDVWSDVDKDHQRRLKKINKACSDLYFDIQMRSPKTMSVLLVSE